MAPRISFKDFAELNNWLAEQCLAISKKRQHPEYKDRTIWEVYQSEQPSLIPVNIPFVGYIEKECSVSSTSLIRYDRNHYSVDSKMAGKTVTVRSSAERIQVVSAGVVVGEHIP